VKTKGGLSGLSRYTQGLGSEQKLSADLLLETPAGLPALSVRDTGGGVIVKPSGPGLDEKQDKGGGRGGGGRTREPEYRHIVTGEPITPTADELYFAAHPPEPRSFQDLDAFIAAAEAIEKRNTQVMANLDRAWLQASGDRIELIEFDRDAQLKALVDSELSEQQLADARILINRTASAEIVAERRHEADAVDQARAGLARQQGRSVDALAIEHRQRQAEIRGSGYSVKTQAQLLALEEQKNTRLVSDAEQTRFRDWLQSMPPLVQDVADGLGSLGQNAAGAFAEAIANGEGLSETLSALANDLQKTLLRMAMMKLIEAGGTRWPAGSPAPRRRCSRSPMIRSERPTPAAASSIAATSSLRPWRRRRPADHLSDGARCRPDGRGRARGRAAAEAHAERQSRRRGGRRRADGELRRQQQPSQRQGHGRAAQGRARRADHRRDDRRDGAGDGVARDAPGDDAQPRAGAGG
jgi:hypothetical protein